MGKGAVRRTVPDKRPFTVPRHEHAKHSPLIKTHWGVINPQQTRGEYKVQAVNHSDNMEKHYRTQKHVRHTKVPGRSKIVTWKLYNPYKGFSFSFFPFWWVFKDNRDAYINASVLHLQVLLLVPLKLHLNEHDLRFCNLKHENIRISTITITQAALWVI